MESEKSIVLHILGGLFVRLLMLSYGNYQDSNSAVKYTDIDYSVYSDAALYVINGSSPYLRETYRYTPVLAWILTPIWTLDFSYGKIVFILFDLLTAYLIFLIVKIENTHTQGVKWSYLWLYNPLPIIICTRGSSESIILALVLSTIYFFQKGAITISGLIYGFAVHFKPYTVPFCLPLYMAAVKKSNAGKPFVKSFFTFGIGRIALILGSIVGFGVPTLVCYWMYGDEFLNETYFYHLTRKDIKHNFSLYFYVLYLNLTNEGLLLKLTAFLPQFLLLVVTGFLFPSKTDLPFTFFVQTYCFVIFNKVCTSQYFLWYLSLLPIIGPKIQMKWTHAVILLMVWYFIQIAWLLPAYYLEFEGRHTFMYVWLASLAFFCGNIGILVQVIKNYKSTSNVARRLTFGATSAAACSSTSAHLQHE